jgi:hypothetical protein
MAGLSTVTINVGSGGIGRRPVSNDRISGIVFYNNTLPSGFSVSLREIKIYSLEEAEALGIAEGSVAHLVEWYHISEFFRANPDGELWIGYYAVPGTGIIGDYTYVDVDTLQRAASGEIRQMGVFTNSFAYATSTATTLQTAVDGLVSDGMPVSVLLAADMSAITAVTGWSAVGDLRALSARHVTVIASQDGGAAGLALFTSESYSITTLGHTLGFLSKASVNQSIGNPENFNASNGIELETIALANGDLVSALTNSALGGIKDDGYQIAIKRTPKMAGTFYDRTPAAVPAIDDFAWVEFSRTVDKAVRLVDSALTPKLLGGVVVNTDGTLTNDTVEYYRDVALQALSGMVADVEVSNVEVTIDPAQDVQATSTLVVAVKIQPTAIAEFITVNIGLTNII